MEDQEISFFGSILPFSQITEKELIEISGGMGKATFSPQTLIIRQQSKGLFFYVIRSGLVKVFLVDEKGQEKVLGFLGEGDCFGEISLLTEGLTTANILAVEETVCYTQKKEDFLQMVQRHPVFLEFFNQLLTQRMRSTYKKILIESPEIGQVEPYLFSKQIKEIIPSRDCSLGLEANLRQAAEKIIREDLEALVIVDGQKKLIGVLDRKDIIQALLHNPGKTDVPVEGLAKQDFQTIDSQNYFFDALHEMVKSKTSFLVVQNGGRVEGMLTGLDLLRFRGREALSLIRNIENAKGFVQLNHLRQEVENVTRALMADGALASQVCRIVSEFNDKIVRKVIQFAEEDCGTPLTPYAWLGLGSEGRKEQSLFTDQDNAIIVADGLSDQARADFKSFVQRVVNGLHECGIPLCKGEVMATNPKFSGSLSDWKTRSAQWIKSPRLDEKDLMDTYSFLDFRFIHGQPQIEQELRSHVNGLIKENPQFLSLIAEGVLEMGIPLGFFKNFIVEKNGAHKDKLSIKLSGLVPLVSSIKILAFTQGLTETNTMERIERLGQEKILLPDQVEILTQAFETLLTLKIRNDLLGKEKLQDFENYINPAHLSTRNKQLLKEAFWAVSEVQKIVRVRLKVRDLGMTF
jgi:CBS domain-containing protein